MKKTDVILGLLLYCSLFAIALAAQENSTCTTTESLPGTCKQVRQCKRLYDLYLIRPRTPTIRNFLNSEVCGTVNNQRLLCCRDEASSTTDPIDVSKHPNVGLINPDLCGKTSRDRIIMGNITGVFEMPWMAMLKYKVNKGERPVERFKCGGALINERYILTAAHCISDTNQLRLVSVRLGEHNLSTVLDCEGTGDEKVCAQHPAKNLRIEKYIKHPGFSTSALKDDIALIRLAQPADVSKNTITPICLPVGRQEQSKSFAGKELTVAGWGITENAVASRVLMKANVPVWSHARCQALFQEGNLTINAEQMCAGGGRQDSCRGDSGGPLAGFGVVRSDGCMVQYGIVSFGTFECGTEGVPGIYTRVGHYMKWILDHMEP